MNPLPAIVRLEFHGEKDVEAALGLYNGAFNSGEIFKLWGADYLVTHRSIDFSLRDFTTLVAKFTLEKTLDLSGTALDAAVTPG